LDAVHRAGGRTWIVLPGASRRRGRRIVGHARRASDAAVDENSHEETQSAKGSGHEFNSEFLVESDERRFPRSQALKFKNMKEKPEDSSSRAGLHAASVSVGGDEKSPEARGLSQTTRDPARIKRNAGRKIKDRCAAPLGQTSANGAAGESSSLNEPLTGPNANGKRNGREIAGKNTAASDDATGTTLAGDAGLPSTAACSGRDACAEVAANGFHAAHDEESGTVDDRRPCAPDDLSDVKNKPNATRGGKSEPTRAKKYPPGVDEPLAVDAPGFGDEMHAQVNLYEVYKDLLSSQDPKVQQRAVELLIEMKYGKGAAANAEEAPRIEFGDLPRPQR
jgi:hypothetical protein